MRSVILVGAIVIGCGGAARAPGAPPPAPSPERAPMSSTPDPAGARCCVAGATPEVLHARPNEVAASAEGLRVVYTGMGGDLFDDGQGGLGSHEQWVALAFGKGDATASRMPSILGPQRPDVVLGVCWRIRSADEDEVVLELGPMPCDAAAGGQ